MPKPHHSDGLGRPNAARSETANVRFTRTSAILAPTKREKRCRAYVFLLQISGDGMEVHRSDQRQREPSLQQAPCRKSARMSAPSGSRGGRRMTSCSACSASSTMEQAGSMMSSSKRDEHRCQDQRPAEQNR